MTDKQIIETLRNLKNNCRNTECINCVFYCINTCTLRELFEELNRPILHWDIEKIEKIIKGE